MDGLYQEYNWKESGINTTFNQRTIKARQLSLLPYNLLRNVEYLSTAECIWQNQAKLFEIIF